MAAMTILRVTLNTSRLARFKELQTNSEKIEYNGEIVIDEQTGEVLRVKERRGQYVEPCNQGCIINWHTHPQDYTKYFPDHPSAQDMKYVLFAVSKTRELVAHMVFTPCFVYVLTLSPELIAIDPSLYDTKAAEIDALFSRVSDAYQDRATEAFRLEWTKGLREMGFLIDRHSGYSQPITLQLRKIDRSAIRNMEADRRRKAAVDRSRRKNRTSPPVLEKAFVFFLTLLFALWVAYRM